MALEEGNLVDGWVCGFYIAVTWDESSVRLACLGRYRADGLGCWVIVLRRSVVLIVFVSNWMWPWKAFAFVLSRLVFGNSWLSLAYTLGLGRPALFSIAWIPRCSARPGNEGTVWLFLSCSFSNGEMMNFLKYGRSDGKHPISQELCFDM